MHHLRAVPTDSEREQMSRSTAVMPVGGSGVVYVDEDASTATITAALQAWGLRVREEREHGHGQAGTQGLTTDEAWATTRPPLPPTSRLHNRRSPVWLPTIADEQTGVPIGDADQISSWFSRAA